MAVVAHPRAVRAAQRPARTPLPLHTRLGTHVLALAVLLAVAFPLMSPTSSFTLDEGAYALQAAALQEGRWTYDYRAADLDPSGQAFPVALSHGAGAIQYPYIQHPAYPLLLKVTSDALGRTIGLHLWALLGTVATAVAGWLLARELAPRLRPWSFWLAAASPVLANGFIIWAHSLSAAVAGLTSVAVVRIAKHGLNGARALAVMAGMAGGVLLRSEGLLFAAAVTIALVIAVRKPVAAALALPPIATAFLERTWVQRIAGDIYDNFETRAKTGGFVAGRISGAWHDLFQASAIGLVALVVVVAAMVVALRKWRPDSVPLIGLAAAVGVGFTVAQFVAYPTQPVSGLFAACPPLLAGAALVPWKRVDPGTRTLGLTVVLFIPAVVATGYAAGGGLEWGGRFYSPLLAPLAVLGVLGLDAGLQAAPSPRGRRTATVLLGALAATGAVVSLLTVGAIRHAHREATAAVARHPASVTVTTVAALPRVAWAIDRQTTWMLTTHARLPGLLADLRSQGVAQVTVVVEPWVGTDRLEVYPTVRAHPEPALHALALTVFELSN